MDGFLGRGDIIGTSSREPVREDVCEVGSSESDDRDRLNAPNILNAVGGTDGPSLVGDDDVTLSPIGLVGGDG